MCQLRSARRNWIQALTALALIPALGVACAQPSRVALVIGNGSYAHTRALKNPTHDAEAVSEELAKFGWRVSTVIDKPKSDLDAAIRTFATSLCGADQGVFYYAGHGVQINGENYLIPIDYEMSQCGPRMDLISLESTLATFSHVGTQLVAVFDACRTRPLTDQQTRSIERGQLLVTPDGEPQSVTVGAGLAEVSAGAGILIAFSTQPGNVAEDGEGDHSPFSGALVKRMGSRKKDIRWILQRVRQDVIEQTGNSQVPWNHSSLVRDFIIYDRDRIDPPR